jgi:sirohydrochlorin ferrochelatase
MSSSEAKTAILLVGHGTRCPGPDELLVRIAAEVQRQIGVNIVETAYCGLQHPDVQTGIDRCAAAGAVRIILYPCFLLSGKHAARDLPTEVARARERYPGVDLRLAAPLGADPGLGRLVSASLEASLAGLGWKSPAVRSEVAAGRK